MVVFVIGVGLIGGSFALALKDKNLCKEVLGFDLSTEHMNKALELGIIDRGVDIEEGMASAELIVIATPVDSAPLLAAKLLNKISKSQVLIDMGSIKYDISEAVKMHANRDRYVATHPMWGTEHSGPQAAKHGAFEGCSTVICNPELSAKDALSLVESIYKSLGSKIIYMDAEDHDTHAAYISHISHISSFALALTVLEKEREEQHIFDMAGTGFESTVRLAKSSARTWAPILMQNRFNVLDVLREHIHQLQILRKTLESNDNEALAAAIEKANTIKKIIS